MATINNVPQDEVGEVVQNFIDDDDAVKVVCKVNPNTQPPTWTVTATSTG